MQNSYWIEGKLPGLNEWVHAKVSNKFYGNTLKKNAQKQIGQCIADMPEYTEPIGINFTWFDSSGRRDFDNICFGKKFILDKMTELGKIKDDSQKYVQWFTDTLVNGKDGVLIEIVTQEKYPISFGYGLEDISEYSVEHYIEIVLKEAGFSSCYNGFYLLKEGLKIIFMDQRTVFNMEKQIYSKISKEYNMTSLAISKSIWTMIRNSADKGLIDPKLLDADTTMTSKHVLLALLSRLKTMVRNERYGEQITKKRYRATLNNMVVAKRNLIDAHNKHKAVNDQYSKSRYNDCKLAYKKIRKIYMRVFNQTPELMAYEIDQQYIKDNYDLYASFFDIRTELTLMQTEGKK